jgi:hypothetical protein
MYTLLNSAPAHCLVPPPNGMKDLERVTWSRSYRSRQINKQEILAIQGLFLRTLENSQV